MNWSELQEMQRQLDKTIMEKHGIEKQDLGKLLVATSVEWHEAINETKFFKYWSTKEMDREKVLEEFSDFLHFLLSICNYFAIDAKKASEYSNFKILDKDLSLHCLRVSWKISNILKESKDGWFMTYQIFGIFIGIVKFFGFEEKDLYEAYLKKNKVNYKRQEEGY